MVTWIQPSNTTIRVVTTTLLGIAIIATFLRLALRIRRSRFWLDDISPSPEAIVALNCSIMLLVDMWLRTDLSQSKPTRIVAYWMVSLSFTNTLWASRMSVIFSVIRLVPEQLKLRKITTYFAAVFALCWIGLLVQKIRICASNKSWYELDKPQCHLGYGVAALELITGPTFRMLFIIFASSLLTTFVSIIHAIMLLGPSGLLEGLTAQAEAATALLVANAGVMVALVYRLLRKSDDIDPKPYTYNYSLHTNGVVNHKVTHNWEHSSVEFDNPSNSSETRLNRIDS
ncbi:hypothetical protein B0H14DRAFT_2588739 [Mycena olivaceomarginata]|nr:hypothetical protein B0H14DRAFT_2588731 [Mycena olivaceomarginata]KAJ7838189.1 hypothetical protein B0H14DRAFT_2588739 [Mycena olivaceomarginata]